MIAQDLYGASLCDMIKCPGTLHHTSGISLSSCIMILLICFVSANLHCVKKPDNPTSVFGRVLTYLFHNTHSVYNHTVTKDLER